MKKEYSYRREIEGLIRDITGGVEILIRQDMIETFPITAYLMFILGYKYEKALNFNILDDYINKYMCIAKFTIGDIFKLDNETLNFYGYKNKEEVIETLIEDIRALKNS